MDTFIEKLVTKQKTSKDRLTSIGLVAAAVIISVIIPFIPLVNTLSPFFVILVIYGAYYFIRGTNLEFEYSVTNGDIDVDKIIAKRKRKRVFSAMTKDIEIIAKKGSDKYSSEYKSIRKRIEAVSTIEADDVYFIVAPYKGERTIIFFQPDQRMLDAFKTRMPRKVFITEG